MHHEAREADGHYASNENVQAHLLHSSLALFKILEGNGIVVAKRHVLTDGNKCSVIESCISSIHQGRP